MTLLRSIIASEVLSTLKFEVPSRIEVLERVKVGYNYVHIKLLQFADDTLFFCQPNSKVLRQLKRFYDVLS